MSYLSNDIADCLAEAETSLEKGKLVLDDLAEKYPFDADKNQKIEAWAFGYKRITTYMDIALDYMCKTSESLRMAKKLEGGAANE